MPKARNETGYPLVWGEPVRQPDGSYRTVVIAPGDPLPASEPDLPSVPVPVPAAPVEE